MGSSLDVDKEEEGVEDDAITLGSQLDEWLEMLTEGYGKLGEEQGRGKHEFRLRRIDLRCLCLRRSAVISKEHRGTLQVACKAVPAQGKGA